MNYARIIALIFCAEEVIVSLAYAVQRDWRNDSLLVCGGGHRRDGSLVGENFGTNFFHQRRALRTR